MDWITAFFSSKSKRYIAILASVIVLSLGLLDWLIRLDVSFAVFYIGPICLVSWYLGKRPGYYFALFSVFVATIAAGHTGGFRHNAFVYSWNAGSELGFYLVISWVFGTLKERLLREWALSRTDPLTGIANSRHFMEKAEHELSLAQRHGHPLVMIYIDCDNFKQINDKNGHMLGDQLLREVAQSIVQQTRHTDTVARLGGDEFGILCPETGPTNHKHYVARVRNSLLTNMKAHGWPVTFSIGVAAYKSAPSSVDEMIRNADDLMYEVKRKGRNGIRYKAY